MAEKLDWTPEPDPDLFLVLIHYGWITGKKISSDAIVVEFCASVAHNWYQFLFFFVIIHFPFVPREQ